VSEVHFQVVKRGTGEELGPARAELQQALEDRRSLVHPHVAEIARVKVRSRGASAKNVVGDARGNGALAPQPSRPQAIRVPR
jgi:hypothetical protein